MLILAFALAGLAMLVVPVATIVDWCQGRG